MQGQARDDYAGPQALDILAPHEEREDWTLLTANQLNACSCALSYVDAKGFRFLIPAFVICDLKRQLGGCSSPYFHLTYNPRTSPLSSWNAQKQKQFIAGRCALLSEEQKAAFQEYLRYYRAENEDNDASLWDTP